MERHDTRSTVYDPDNYGTWNIHTREDIFIKLLKKH